MSWYRVAVVILCAGMLCACTGHHTKTVKTKGVYHRVKTGDTLWSIARAYNINVQDLAEINNITDSNVVKTDSVLFIPDANEVIDDVMATVESSETPVEKPAHREKKVTEQKSGKDGRHTDGTPQKKGIAASRDTYRGKGGDSPGEDSTRVVAKIDHSGLKPEGRISVKQEKEFRIEQKNTQRANGKELQKIRFERDRFIWPVKGKVRSKFGIQPNGMYHNGIKIEAREGASVMAAANGTVIYSAPVKDYGETIIIKHEDGYATVYTHLGDRLVKVNEHVKKGARIASLGKSENKGEAHLSFEVRYKNKARNPLFFLP
jgi:lipoprotein NlpD